MLLLLFTIMIWLVFSYTFLFSPLFLNPLFKSTVNLHVSTCAKHFVRHVRKNVTIIDKYFLEYTLFEVIGGLKEYNKRYFITSVLFSIGNHNIRCTKQKFIIGKPHTPCISLHTQCIKLKSYISSFPHIPFYFTYLYSYMIYTPVLFFFVALLCNLTDSLWRFSTYT